MKLSNYIIPTLLLLAIVVVSCELRDDGNRVADITLEQTSATLEIGENLQLSAVLTPADVTNPNIIWSSSNVDVATVSDGIVTGVSEGTTTITATTQDGGHIATSAVTVRATAPPPTDPDPAIPVTGVTVSPTIAELAIGGTQQLTATVLPSNATNQTVTWESNDNSIATVDNDGLVTAVAEGSATITVTTVDGGYTATSAITVTPISVTGVTLYPPTATLLLNNRMQLIAIVLPTNATNQNVTWSSSDNAIATVNSNGLVTAVALGSATITVMTEDGGYTATSVITMSMPIGCNDNTPSWGASLGTVSFYTNETWTITRNDITQTWSDAVTASGCQKTTFTASTAVATCRSNPDFPGDLFSWCAVVRFADQLCPYPWRFPTNNDFRDLDIALGGNGFGSPATVARVNNEYIERWGGAFGGWTGMGQGLTQQGFFGTYWSQSQHESGMHARTLVIGTDGSIAPQMSNTMSTGSTLRCVR